MRRAATTEPDVFSRNPNKSGSSASDELESFVPHWELVPTCSGATDAEFVFSSHLFFGF
jgi:hypothetical protein